MTLGESTATSLRVNNFDLIRLLAALQVLVYHAVGHLQASELEWLATAVSYFPGVPIFFVISGFLISLSWERAPSLKQYLWNRALRIYPALWVCLVVSIAIAFAAGVRPESAASFLVWLAAQSTFAQFYNPDWLRSFGVGVLNGSLWTIVVELQFYLVLPLLAILASGRRLSWLAIGVVSFVLMLIGRSYMLDWSTVPQKLVGVSLVPYLFYFVIGVIARDVHRMNPKFFADRGHWWFGVYLLWVAVEIWLGLPGSGGNVLNPVSILLLGGATVSLAFTKRDLSMRILRGNDMSYGIYIYHMPVVNTLLFLGITRSLGASLVLVITMTCAFASWRLIEKPALGLKGYSMRWTPSETAREQVTAASKRSW